MSSSAGDDAGVPSSERAAAASAMPPPPPPPPLAGSQSAGAADRARAANQQAAPAHDGAERSGGSSSSRSKRKRSSASSSSGCASSSSSSVGGGLFSGVTNSLEDKDVEFLCPICFELIREAHMTKCGHTFCYDCIVRSLESRPVCPKCNFHLESKEGAIFPNFILNELVAKHKNSVAQRLKRTAVLLKPELGSLREFLHDNSQRLGLPDVEFMLSLLSQRRDEMAAECYLTQQQLLREFLTHLKRQKDDQLFQLQRESNVIRDDLEQVDRSIHDYQQQNPSLLFPPMSSDSSAGGVDGAAAAADDGAEADSGALTSDDAATFLSAAVAEAAAVKDEKPDAAAVVPTLEGFNILKDKSLLRVTAASSSLPQRRKRMHHHFDDLANCYFSTRVQEMMFPKEDAGPDSFEALDEFSGCLNKFTRYNGVRPLATLSYTTDMFNNASIVSSIEFDKDNEFFAIAGVTKRIKIYDYNVVLKDMVDIHYPSMEMVCNSKISCITWNSFHKGTLASSDYEGTVIVWDANSSTKLRTFQEHEKRCWSVDFNLVDTKLIASGSDDARVKLWSTNINHSVASLEAKANVCCVKFNPSSCYHLAFGSADHCVHYYDLRNTKSALSVFKGHRKAVSYVKFLNSEQLVSASTDSQLKLWSVNSESSCLRSFQGHVNEKNFVGLASDGDYITCGSENNGLYIYYKGLSKHLFSFKFDAVRSMLDRDRKDEDLNEFVSAVCWRQGTNVIVAANSQGTIKVLELV